MEARSQSSFKFSGYLSDMPSYIWSNGTKQSFYDNLVHNRLNFEYSPSDKVKLRMELRNRMFWGQTVESTPLFKYIITNDSGWLDMSFNLGSGDSYLVNSVVDRLSYEYESGNFQFKLGRQRVDWGQAKVWNPNDIFNTYSYFDFDYVERPSMDGLRMQYSTGVSSKIEGVIKVDGSNRISAATLYKFNSKGFDIQLLAGEVSQDAYVLGGGWSGSVVKANFYGELSFLSPFEKSDDRILIASVGGNYTLNNSLLLEGEYLYSSNFKNYDGRIDALLYNQGSIENLSIADHSYMLSGSYPLSSLFTLSFAYMGFSFPVLNSFYLGPKVDYSITDNLDISGVFQLFSQEIEQKREVKKLSFIRLKWNF